MQRPGLSARLPRAGLPSAHGRGRSVAITARPGSAEIATVRLGAISGRRPKFHEYERSHGWGMDKATRLMMPLASHLTHHLQRARMCLLCACS